MSFEKKKKKPPKAPPVESELDHEAMESLAASAPAVDDVLAEADAALAREKAEEELRKEIEKIRKSTKLPPSRCGCW